MTPDEFFEWAKVPARNVIQLAEHAENDEAVLEHIRLQALSEEMPDDEKEGIQMWFLMYIERYMKEVGWSAAFPASYKFAFALIELKMLGKIESYYDPPAIELLNIIRTVDMKDMGK